MNQADVVIYNDSGLEQLYEQLDRVWDELGQRYALRMEGATG